MSTERAVGYGVGINFSGLLTILFIGLKLTHHIDWSWFWVLSPIWGSFAFVLVLMAAYTALLFINLVLDELRKK